MKKKKSEEILFHIKKKGRGEQEGIWMLEDNSIFSVLQVTPIPFNDLKKHKQEEIIKKYNEEFIKKLDFPVEILIRPVNTNFDKKISILESLLSYNINKTEKPKLIEYFESFMKWFMHYVSKNVRPQFVYYVVVNYNTYIQKRKFDEQYSRGVKILKKRLDFVKNTLNSIGLNVKQLSTREIENIYDSFLRLHFYSGNKYLLPEDWLNLHKKTKGDQS